MSDSPDGCSPAGIGCSCGCGLFMFALFAGLAWRIFKWTSGVE